VITDDDGAARVRPSARVGSAAVTAGAVTAAAVPAAAVPAAAVTTTRAMAAVTGGRTRDQKRGQEDAGEPHPDAHECERIEAANQGKKLSPNGQELCDRRKSVIPPRYTAPARTNPVNQA
jgi:hypothetical protein